MRAEAAAAWTPADTNDSFLGARKSPQRKVALGPRVLTPAPRLSLHLGCISDERMGTFKGGSVQRERGGECRVLSLWSAHLSPPSPGSCTVGNVVPVGLTEEIPAPAPFLAISFYHRQHSTRHRHPSSLSLRRGSTPSTRGKSQAQEGVGSAEGRLPFSGVRVSLLRSFRANDRLCHCYETPPSSLLGTDTRNNTSPFIAR